MNKDKIKKSYKQKIEKLIKFNKAYFEKDSPIVSDLEFDNLKKELIDLSKQYPFLQQINNPEELVGSKP